MSEKKHFGEPGNEVKMTGNYKCVYCDPKGAIQKGLKVLKKLGVEPTRKYRKRILAFHKAGELFSKCPACGDDPQSQGKGAWELVSEGGQTRGRTATNWLVIRRLVEQKLYELGISEDVLTLVMAYRGHIAPAIILTLLLFPITLPLIVLFIIPGFIWLVYLATRDYNRIISAGGNVGSMILTIVLSIILSIMPGVIALTYWVVYPLFGIKIVLVVRTRQSIVIFKLYNIFNIPTFSSVNVFPSKDVAIELLSCSSSQPKILLSGVPSFQKLQILRFGRNELDQTRDIQILTTARQESCKMPADNKKCPLCAETIKPEALVCRYCGHRLAEVDIQNTRCEQEEVVAVSTVAPTDTSTQSERDSIRKTWLWFSRLIILGLPLSFLIIGLPMLVAGIVLGFGLLYKFWQLLQKDGVRITPRKAVGFCFIPLFQYYWFFIAVFGLAKNLNAACSKRGLSSRPVAEHLSLVYCIVLCSLWALALVSPWVYLAGLIIAIVLPVVIWKLFTDLSIAILDHQSQQTEPPNSTQMIEGQPQKSSISGITYKGKEVANGNTYQVYTASSWNKALEFLRDIEVQEERRYIIVETPTGNVGKDLVMIFDERTSEKIEFGVRRPLPTLRTSRTNCTRCGYPVLPAGVPTPGTKEMILLGDMKEKGVGFFCTGCNTAWCPFCVSDQVANQCPMCKNSMTIYRD